MFHNVFTILLLIGIHFLPVFAINAVITISQHVFLSPGDLPLNNFSEVTLAKSRDICIFNFNSYSSLSSKKL